MTYDELIRRGIELMKQPRARFRPVISERMVAAMKESWPSEMVNRALADYDTVVISEAKEPSAIQAGDIPQATPPRK